MLWYSYAPWRCRAAKPQLDKYDRSRSRSTTMIITPDDQASKRLSDSKAQPPAGHDDPPPSYSPSDASGSVPPPTFKTKPTNFLALANERDAIKGEFVIDPCLCIPPSMLPPLDAHATEADRNNLCLASKHGSVNAEIWLLGSSSPGGKSRRTTLALTSSHGSIRAQVHTLDGAAPFSLTGRSSHGTIRLAIPRSFQGLLSLSTRHGSVSVSDAIVQNATQLSQLDTARRYFVGDFALLGAQEAWEGDQVELEAPHGTVRVKYDDEEAEGQGKKGLFSRLFGK